MTAAVLFDGSFDGFLCIVYAYYYERIHPLYIQTEEVYQTILEAEEYYIVTDMDKAARVLEGIRKKTSPDAAYFLYNAFLAGEEDKYMDLFQYVILGFKVGKALDQYLQENCVLRVHRLAKYVGHEAHLLSGFCRFAETKEGIYYCEIAPKNNVLLLLAEHFRNRFMGHAWVIYDKKRAQAVVYNGEGYTLYKTLQDENGGVSITYADNESQTQDWWTVFFNTIAIKERKNYKLQRQHIPLHFRGPMTEFQKRLLNN